MESNRPDSESPKKRLPLVRLGFALCAIGVAMYFTAFMMGARSVDISLSMADGLVVSSVTSADRSKVNILSTPFDHVCVQTTSFRIEVRPSENFGVFISGTYERPAVSVTHEGRLEIDTHAIGHISLFSFGFSQPKIIHIYAPLGHPLTFDIQSTSGGIVVDGVSWSEGIAQSVSGSITLRNNTLAIQSTHAVSTSGSIYMSGITWHGLDIQSTSGSISISGSPYRNRSAITMQSTSGSISANIHAARDDFAVRMISTSGSMRLDGVRQQGPTHDVEAEQNHSVSMQTTSGSIRLDFAR